MPVLRLAFHKAGLDDVVMSNQRYAFAAPAELEGSGTLFDDQTGRRASIPLSGCEPMGSELSPLAPTIQGDVLAFDCWHPLEEQWVRLYSIASAGWRTVPLSPEITSCEAYMGVCPWGMISAGSYWLGFSESSCEMDEHCTGEDVFQSIRTGQVVQDPAVAHGHEIGNVDDLQLAQPLCSPLAIPAEYVTYSAPGPGPIELDGRFALATTIGPDGTPETYLEECGTHIKQLVQPYETEQYANPIASNTRALAWQASATNLTIEFLPSRDRYTVPLPKSVQGDVQLALTTRRLYLLQNSEPPDQNGRLWIATFPAR
jgi:hypothetical protein